jgi:membrane-bound ClpP family serine protease
VLIAISSGMAAFLILLIRTVGQSRKLGYVGPIDALVGQEGKATTQLDPRGTVQVGSELWSAVSDSGETIGKGAEVVVVELDGLTVKVVEAGGPRQ